MRDSQQSSDVSRGVAIIGMVITFLGGYFFGQLTSARAPDGGQESTAATAERIHVPAGLSPSLGPANALVTIVEFADYQCTYCARSVGLRRRIVANYKGKVRWVFKNFPLGFHKRAKKASKASMVAHAMGYFWEYHDLLFVNQQRMADRDLAAHAQELGLDQEKYQEGMKSPDFAKLVQADIDLANKLKVNGTPTFFINGRKHVGSISQGTLDRLITEELAHVGSLLRNGVSRIKLYQELTRDKTAATAKDTAATEAK